MNHSLYSADRTTHLKIVALALMGATAVAAICIAAHSGRSDGLAQAERVPVVKAGKPVMVTSTIRFAVR